jgi:hypothetical protein
VGSKDRRTLRQSPTPVAPYDTQNASTLRYSQLVDTPPRYNRKTLHSITHSTTLHSITHSTTPHSSVRTPKDRNHKRGRLNVILDLNLQAVVRGLWSKDLLCITHTATHQPRGDTKHTRCCTQIPAPPHATTTTTSSQGWTPRAHSHTDTPLLLPTRTRTMGATRTMPATMSGTDRHRLIATAPPID